MSASSVNDPLLLQPSQPPSERKDDAPKVLKPSLSLSRCTFRLGKKVVPSTITTTTTSRAGKSSSAFTKDHGTSKPCVLPRVSHPPPSKLLKATMTTKKKKDSWKKMPPIPSFGGAHYANLKRLEKEFLGEDVSDNDDDDSDSADLDVKSHDSPAIKLVKQSLSFFSPRPPIPNFYHGGVGGGCEASSNEEDDSDDTEEEEEALKLFSSIPTNFSNSRIKIKEGVPKKKEQAGAKASKCSSLPSQHFQQQASRRMQLNTNGAAALSASCPSKLETVAEEQEMEEVEPYDDKYNCTFDPNDDNKAACTQHEESRVSSTVKPGRTVAQALESSVPTPAPASLADNFNHIEPTKNRFPEEAIHKEKANGATHVGNEAASIMSSKRNHQAATNDDSYGETSNMAAPCHHDDQKNNTEDQSTNSKPDANQHCTVGTTSNADTKASHDIKFITETSADNSSLCLISSIDTLYEQIDKETVTVKTFYKSLEKTLGIKMDKGMKLTIRERLTALVSGRATPSIPLPNVAKASHNSSNNGSSPCDLNEQITISTEDDTATTVTMNIEKRNATVGLNKVWQEACISEPKTVLEVPSDRRSKPLIQDAIGGSSSARAAEVVSCKEKPTNTKACLSSVQARQDPGQSKKRSAAAEPKDDDTDQQPKRSKHKMAKEVQQRSHSSCKMGASNDTRAHSSILDPVKVEVAKRVSHKQNECKPGKENKSDEHNLDTTATGNLLAPPLERDGNDASDNFCRFADQGKTLAAVPSKKAPGRRKRGRPTKSSAVECDETCDKAAVVTSDSKAELPCAAPPARNRKRTRKGTCALCSTCPCQNSHGDTSATILDFKSMSRNDVAVEKALIRRVQKLEKSTEHMEGQMEIVKRRLKTHRRDMWKKRQTEALDDRSRQIGGPKPASRFLPDVQELEGESAGGKALEWEQVEQAQRRLFSSIPSKWK
jgi:hypothetical protein